MITTGPGDLHVAPVPCCHLHGPMRWIRSGNVWACRECGNATAACDVEWTYIGKTEGAVSFTAPLDNPNARIAPGGERDENP